MRNNRLSYQTRNMKAQKHTRRWLRKSFMAKPKRTPLSFDNNQLTDDLKASAGQGVDAFFSSPVPPANAKAERTPPSDHIPASPSLDPERQANSEDTRNEKKETPKQLRNRDTTIPRHHETMVSRYHQELTETVRKAVKEFGK